MQTDRVDLYGVALEVLRAGAGEQILLLHDIEYVRARGLPAIRSLGETPSGPVAN